MSKEGRISLGREWKRKLLENKQGARWVIPGGVTLSHPYILEAEEAEDISKVSTEEPPQFAAARKAKK